MDQFDQLLTCPICLDRYRIPKLLPCQHSFCLEPCMENLQDFVRRQIKCPECRACHSIPYNGVQAFPTNVTLIRFLDIHLEVTGELPDPNANQMMERCQVCSEKSYLSNCSHCDKKICSDCKESHMEVMKREITRISNQVKRVIHRLDDAVSLCEKNSIQLQQNTISIVEEVDDLERRLAKALKDRMENLKHELEKYKSIELKTITNLKHNLEQELSNIQSNCEIVEKYLAPETTTAWQDNELMDAKDIFLKTMDFLRNFEYDPGDYGRRIRFTIMQDPNTLCSTLTTLGELILPAPTTINQPSNSYGANPNQSSGLLRSKSDHRLTTQFKDYEQDGRTSPVFGRSRNRYGEEPEPERKSSRFRSRFTRHLDSSYDQNEPESGGGRGVRFENEKKERERVLDVDDVTRGPMSGITRLGDSPVVIQRIQDVECPKIPKEKAPAAALTPAQVLPPAPWRLPRQQSEDDEVSKQKKMNKEAESSNNKRAPSVAKRQLSTEPKSPITPHVNESGERSERNTAQTTPETRTSRKLSPERYPPAKARDESSDSGSSESSSASTSSSRNTGAAFSTEEMKSRFLSKSNEGDKPGSRTNPPAQRKDSGNSATSNTSTNRYQQPKFTAGRQTPAVEAKESSSEESSEESTDDDEEEEEVLEKKIPEKTSKMEKTDIGPLLARSANARDRERETHAPAREVLSRQDSSSSSTYSKDREPVSSSLSSAQTYRKRESSPPQSLAAYRRQREAASRISSPPVRDNYGSSATSSNRYGIGSSDYGSSLTRSRTGTSLYQPEEPTSRYSKYLNRSRHTFDDPTTESTSRPSSYDKGTASASSIARDRRSRISRSKSSHDVLGGIDPEELEQLGIDNPDDYVRSRRKSTVTQPVPDNDSASLSSWARYLKNKYGKGQTTHEDNTTENTRKSPKLSSLSSPFASKKSPGEFTWPRGVACGDGIIAVADSSNHRIQIFDQHGNFVKCFGTYGNSEGEFDCLSGVAINRIGQIIVSDRYNHRVQIFDPSGNYLRSFGSQGSSEGKFSYPWGVSTDALGFIYVADKENNRIQVFQSDGTFVGKIVGDLDQPHYVAVTNTNKVVVADTGNHKIKVFDVNGKMLTSFGSEGTQEGSEFKLPRGIAVSEEGYIIVGDAGNNRIQFFTPEGTFIKSIGTWGSGDTEFKGLEGVAVMASSNNLVAVDRELHRISIF